MKTQSSVNHTTNSWHVPYIPCNMLQSWSPKTAEQSAVRAPPHYNSSHPISIHHGNNPLSKHALKCWQTITSNINLLCCQDDNPQECLLIYQTVRETRRLTVLLSDTSQTHHKITWIKLSSLWGISPVSQYMLCLVQWSNQITPSTHL